ncbi:MAG TPA: ATP-binding protein, partial [Cytophagales bacterium]|nr:ATP-binding protein [Cytophagales bacterium]
VKPIIKDHKKSAIVLFRDSEDKGISDIEQEKFSLDIHTTRYIADLERKLREAQAELDASLETIQNFHDQAQAYNEELVSSNEEMQSTNEELQSVNEELQTINNEHQAKIKELAELNDDLNNYFRGSVSGQIMVDRNLIIKRFTPATTKQINLIENDLGRSLTNISTNVRFEGMIDDISKVISESIVCEKEIQVKNGNWYQMIIKPYVRQQDNRIDGAIITFNDITSLKQSQEKLIETNAEALIQKNIELTKINQDLDGFIYTASHDLKSPISNIEGLLQAITQNDCYKDKELQPLFEMMEKSVDRLKRTIAELTEISKIQKSIQEDIQEIHLEELIDEVKFSVFNLFNEKNATLNLDLDECPRIKFSTKNLRSILYNLVSNALKYSAPDRKVEISIRSQAFNGYSVLTVQDNGLGIKKSNLMDIFSMFKRFHDHVEGTGIGLYMVKRIVENAGGKIEVESEVDKGTTFRIYLKQN